MKPSHIAVAILSALTLIALAIGGYQLGWWLEEEGTNRRTGIANDSLARQQAALDEALDKAGTVADIDVQLGSVDPDQAQLLTAQRIAILDQFCAAYGSLTGQLTVPQSLITLNAQECQ